MKKLAPGALAGLAAAVLLAAPALAAPGTVSVRIEGTAQTLVPPTSATTTATPVGKDGKNCPGTTAFGAMHAATGGDWAGTYFDDYSSWFVETIKGETHASAEAGYWAVWVNNVHSDLGLCGAELQQGDALLIVPDNAGPILELGGIPASVAPGQSVTVQVTEYGFVTNPDYSTTTTPKPADGATVTFGGATATTGADGKAQLTFNGAGPVTIQATEAGHVRSAAAVTCVTTGNDGNCGSQLPPGTQLGTEKPDDNTAPVARLSGIKDGARFSRKRAPRELKGTVSADPSGIKSVRLSILRRHKGRCWAFDGDAERFKRHRCGGSRSFRIGDRAEWSYLLPKRLPVGRYTIRVAAIDKAGNAAATRTGLRVR
jgi:hypothetical protein